MEYLCQHPRVLFVAMSLGLCGVMLGLVALVYWVRGRARRLRAGNPSVGQAGLPGLSRPCCPDEANRCRFVA